jgi:hypothetical protein
MTKISDSTNINSIQVKEQGSAPTTPASGYGRIYCKAGGLYYVGDDGVEIGPLAAAVATPGIVRLGQTVLDANAASITFSSISGSYRNLMLIISGATNAAQQFDGVKCTINDDGGSNYDYVSVYTHSGGTPTKGGSSAAAYWVPGFISGANSGAGAAGSVSMTVPNYSGSTLRKTFHSLAGRQDVQGGLFVENYFGVWRNTAAITKLVLAPVTGTQFVAGTVATLYGMN